MTLDRAARHGIITRRPAAIEEASSIQSVAFDKEATLTTGRLILSNIFAPYPFSRPELMRVAAALTKEAGHPLAAAIAGQAPDEAGGSPSVQVLSSHELNISGTVDGRETVMGSNAFLTGLGIKTHTFLRKYSEYLSHGSLVLFVAVGGETVGLLSFIDDMRPETFSTIKTIKSINQGKIVMLTPEEERAANSASRPLGFTQALSKISRAAKAVTVKKLHHRHGGVLFVGNDQTEEAVFANADISVAADVRKDPWNALKKADIVMLGEGLNSLSELFRLSSKYRKGVKTAKRLLFLGKLAIFAAVIFNFIYLWQGLILDGLWGFILVTAARSLLR
jgi:P-type E1-E2 ATPase